MARRNPTLVIVSGPPGAGKTTLAHLLARRIGCPAICRDEIKEGMVHAVDDFAAAPGDALTMRTLPTFFQVLQLLLTAGVTTVAEAAFQDHVWRPRLEPMMGLADIRVVHCEVTAATALSRIERRFGETATRHAHADAHLGDHQTHAVGHNGFHFVQLGAPAITVDTSDGYRPELDDILAFVNAGR